MLDVLLLLAATQADPTIIRTRDPPQGPMPGENRTLSQPHANDFPEGMFPDVAIRDMRIEGHSLHVLVANEGRIAASGPIRVTARAQFDGFQSLPSDARTSKLKAGERRWIVLRNFSVNSAAAGRAPLMALQNAASVSASISLPPPRPAVLDRSGQLRDRDVQDLNPANNSLTAAGSSLVQGRR